MVTTNRKLQTEIDRLLKKVSEGIEDFDEILKKVHGAVNPNQKEKYEAELKKEIKKLQRYRDQIKSWCTSSEIKNKAPLVDARKVIESRMELFKQCERETKTKPYSKEALARTEEMTEEDRSRGETAAWITRSIEELQQQIDAFEAELETTRKRRGDSRAATLAHSVERHRFHIDRLELMLRLLHNERLTPEQISDVRDGVDYYIQANAEEEFLEDDTLYESLGLFDEDEDGDGGSSSDASGDDGAAADAAAASATDAAASEAEAKTSPPAAAVASPPMSPQKHPALPALPTLASAAASAVAAAAAHGHKAPAASAPSTAAATVAAAEKGKPKPVAAPAAPAQPAATKQQAKPQSQSPPQQPVQQKPQATAAQIVARSLSGSGSSSPPVAPAPAPALVPAPAQKAAPAQPQQQPPLPPSQPKPAASAPAPAPVAASAPRPVPPAQQKPAVAQPPPSPKRLSVSRGSGSGELPPAETLPAAHAMSTSAPSQPTAAVQAPAAAPAPAPAPLAFLLEKHAFLQQLAMQPKEPAPQQQQQQPAAPRQESGGLPIQTLAQMTAAQQAARMHSSSPPAIATQAAPAPAPAPAQPKRAYMPYVPAGMRPLVQSPPPTAAAPVASPPPPPPPSQPPVAAAPAATVPATASAPSQPSSAPAHVPQQPSHPATYLPPVAQAVASAVAAVQSPPTLAPAPAPAPPTTPPVPTAATGPASQGAAVPSVAMVPQRALPRPVAPTESHDLPSFLEASMANQSRFPGEAERARTYTPRRELTAMPSWFPTAPLSSLCTPAHMAKLDPDTLFFIFYYQQNTYQQYLAAQELKRQAWRYHKKYLTWFQRHDEPREITADYETGTYIYFDYETDWCQRMKADFTFEYRFLEE